MSEWPRKWTPQDEPGPIRVRSPVYRRRGTEYEYHGYATIEHDPTGVEVWIPEEVLSEVCRLVDCAMEERRRIRAGSAKP